MISFFQYGGHPPFWICCVADWITHEGSLVVFITVQNSVGIDAVVWIMDNLPVLIFCLFGLKTPIHAPFWWGLGHISPK